MSSTMELADDWVETLGRSLAEARQQETIADLRLDHIRTGEAAHGVQTAAIDAYGGNPIGHTLQATSALSRRQLWCEKPFFGPILDLEVTRTGGRFRLPRGVLGA